MPKIEIWKIIKICISENSQNFQFSKFQIIPKFYNFENRKISEIVHFRIVENFQNFAI